MAPHSIARTAAGASGFFTLTQSAHRPDGRPIAPLREDAFQPHRAGMPEHGRAVGAFDMLWKSGHHRSPSRLAAPARLGARATAGTADRARQARAGRRR